MQNPIKYNPLNVSIFILLNFLNVLIGNKIIIKIFRLHNIKERKLLIVQTVLSIFTNVFLPTGVNSIVNILIQMILYKRFLKLETEKMCLAIIINSIISIISETLIIIKKSMSLELINIVSLMEVLMKLILITLVNKKNIEFNLEECSNEKSKCKISIISAISLIVIFISKLKLIADINIIPAYLYILFDGIIVAYLAILMKNILAILKENYINVKVENLEGSNKRLQENYDNVRAFKHDFNNIMQGIGGLIIAKDINGLENMYKSISKECQEINEKQAINADIINNPAILNLINNKIKLAEEKDIKIKVEVYIDLNSLKVSTYDLCRVLGILIDNAIEASIGCDEKVISIRFLRDKYNNRNLIVIENPCKNYLIDIKKIYEKGFSSKKDKISHGLGLWKVKQILKKNKNIQIYTSRDKLFKQQLEIY